MPIVRIIFLSLALIGCDADNEVLPQSQSSSSLLVNVFGWSVVELEHDPFYELWSNNVRYRENEHGVELLADVWVYSVQTGNCNWLTVQQPSRNLVRAGDLVRAEIWHFALTAPEAASAWVGLASADGILVKIREPIPQAARLIELEFTAQRDITEDTPIYFHVSNHGANSWHLLNIEINPDGAEL